MTVHPAGADSPEQPDVTPAERSAVEPAPTSVLDLVNRTLADPGRTDNAMKIMASVSQGAASVILRIGIVGVVGIVLVGVLIHFSGFGPAIGGAVAAGGLGAVAGGRYLWNRRTAKRRGANQVLG